MRNPSSGPALLLLMLAALLPGCPEDQVVDHVMTFDGTGSTTIEAKKLIFKPGGSIRVIHGAKLMITAQQIVADGTDAVIDGTGDDIQGTGPNGAPCDSCGSDAISASSQQFNEWQAGCSNHTAAHSDWGHDAPKASKGGAGASIIIRTKEPSIGAVRVTVAGGRGQLGGAGGSGRHICDQACGPGHRETYCVGGNGGESSRGDQGDPGTFENHIPKS
ncbi:MAG: hypothetical protein JST92_09690 [Deltaproteobacteria bacterium]|nr:hypothetical protein [Deltaproteobacteria bacterium]